MTTEKIIDFAGIKDEQSVYKQLAETLQLPEHFGNNIDALYDSLTGDVALPVKLRFQNMSDKQQGEYSEIISTIMDAAEDTGEIEFTIDDKQSMTWDAYLDYFKKIVDREITPDVYKDPHYYDYTKLNWARTNRWLKNPGIITEETKRKITAIADTQEWILITEPWCGDAAHVCPIIKMMSDINPDINLKIQLRDSGSEIEKYLTNGTSKAIPILVVRNENGEDLFHWGPRPFAAQHLYDEMRAKDATFDDLKIALQTWYNDDKSLAIQSEVAGKL